MLSNNKKVIAVYPLSNNASVNLYEIKHSGINDSVLAGINNEKPKWYKLKFQDNGDIVFLIGELEIPMSECIRV